MAEKYLSGSILRRKLNYIFRTCSMSDVIKSKIREALDKSLVTNVEVLVHAHWIKDWCSERDWDGGHANHTIYTCSNCGHEEDYRPTDRCISCHAVMDEEVTTK